MGAVREKSIRIGYYRLFLAGFAGQPSTLDSAVKPVLEELGSLEFAESHPLCIRTCL